MCSILLISYAVDDFAGDAGAILQVQRVRNLPGRVEKGRSSDVGGERSLGVVGRIGDRDGEGESATGSARVADL